MTDANHDDYDYFAPDSEFLVVRSQPPLAVYRNTFDDVVIRQEAEDGADSDACIRCRPENLATLIEALSKYLPSGGAK